VIIDCHTHIFPPEVSAARDDFLASDPTFRQLYASPKATLAAAGDLLASMERSGVGVSVALGFAWTGECDCWRHNDYLLESADQAGGRIIPFYTLPLASGASAVVAEAERCIAAGALGFGELRPESLGVDLDGELGDALATASGGTRPLLFHVSEPVGHAYPGKEGFALTALYRFVQTHPDTPVIAAHWGGGLPFYALMPEVKSALSNCSFDTAASSLLYEEGVYQAAVSLVGADKVLFGSDFPLLGQASSRRRIEAAGLRQEQCEQVLGANAARLLGLQ
jgi:predicted TIM-barrel fold metal-dependent hydrolase